YQRRARSRSEGHSEYRKFPIVPTKVVQSSPVRGGDGRVQSTPSGSGTSAIPLRGRGTDTRQQVQHAETGDAIARIFHEPQQREHVLDVRGVQKLQTAVLHERDVATGEFDLQRSAM